MGSEENGKGQLQQSVAVENGGGKKRNFASKLQTLRTYREIPKDELTSGDLIKQTIKPRGQQAKPATEDDDYVAMPTSLNSPSKTTNDNDVASPTIVIKPDTPATTSNGTPPPSANNGQPKLLAQVAALSAAKKKEPKSNRVSFNERADIVEIPSVMYLEKLHNENDHLQKKLNELENQSQDLFKQNLDFVQQNQALENQINDLTKKVNSTTSNLAPQQKDEISKEIDNLSKQRDEALKRNQDLLHEKEHLIQEKRNIETAQDSVLEELAERIDTDKKRIRELEHQLGLDKSDTIRSPEVIELQQTVTKYEALLKETNSHQKSRDLVSTAINQRQIEDFHSVPLNKLRNLFYVQMILWALVVILLILMFTDRVSLFDEKRAT